MKYETYLQSAFLIAVAWVLAEAFLLQTGGHEPSALDGMYAPVVTLVATYVMLYLSGMSLRAFLASSLLFYSTLSVMPMIKYQFLWGGDVNYMYRIITTVNEASTYTLVRWLPSWIAGIYTNFPGFIVLNVIFAKTTGLQTLDGYRLLLPIAYGILYPVSLFLLSCLLTKSDAVRRSSVLAAVVPYASLPGQVWNYYLMPLVLSSILFLLVLYLTLKTTRSVEASLVSGLLMVALIVTHPLISLYTVILLLGLVLFRLVHAQFARVRIGSNPSTAFVAFSCAALLGWWTYSGMSDWSFGQSAARVLISAFSEGFAIPSVTMRLQQGGPVTFLITHLSKLMIGTFALLGLYAIARGRLREVRIDHRLGSAAALLVFWGMITFVPLYTFYDIYVAYRSLFFIMIVLTIAAGMGLFVFTRRMIGNQTVKKRKLRQAMLGAVLIVILTASLFELYPTEYVNRTVRNATHTVYEKNAVEFMDNYWNSSGLVAMDPYTYHVAQSYLSLGVFEQIESPLGPGEPPYTLAQVTVADSNTGVPITRSIVYSSGSILITTIPG